MLAPLLAMQLMDQMDWGLFDFVLAGFLISGAGFTYELITNKINDLTYRVAVGIAFITALLLVWINLAVGIIGSESNPANLMYIGVLVILITGSIIARLKSEKMMRALFATAIAQALVPAFALIAGKLQFPSMGFLVTFSVNTLFVLLFIISAVLFRRSSKN